ncbi:MAG: ABC transporter permease subunit/CPBP intramembrane protease [Planctomycetota bacterium]|jgi:sodium transport system permease protein
MRSRTVRLIAAKELLDTLRDRRTLFVALVLPLLLYPALLLGLTQVIGVTHRNLESERQRVLLNGDGGGTELADLLRAQKLEPVAARLALRDDVAQVAQADSDVARARLRLALGERDLKGAVVCGEGFGERIRRDQQAQATLVFDSTDEASKIARRKVRAALAAYEHARREDLRQRFPGEEARLRFAEAPVQRTEVEVASRSQKGAYSFAPLLGILIVIMALTGAFYPAVDLAAGEKERGTLETLLVAPVLRREIVLGKFFAVWVIAVVTALLNLLVMGLTFSKLAGMIGTGQIAFSLPFRAMLAVSVILVPTAALFAAIALALSSFATSYKEGQHYMSPLFIVAMPLAMLGLLPNTEIGYGLALVPVANVVLLVKAMLLDVEAMGPALVAFLATAAYAVVGLGAAVTLFRREAVLFRAGSGRSYDAISFAAAQAGLPRESRAVLLFFVVVALMFYLSSNITTTAEAIGAFVKAQLVAVLLPTILFAYRGRVHVRRTFSLAAPRAAILPVVVVAAASTLTLVVAFQQYVMPARDPQGFEKLVGLMADLPGWVFFCMLAVVPPICEEIFCRGFLLAAFRPRFGSKAILITAVLFGALHLDWMRFPATCAAGLMLGYVCVRTGSLFAAILFHMTYNGIIATELGGYLDRPSPGLILAAGAALAGSIYVLARTAPAGIDKA